MSLYFAGCSDDPTSIGEDFMNKNIDYFSDTTCAKDSSFSYQYENSTQYWERLYIGKNDNISSSSLILTFDTYPADSILTNLGNLEFQSAKILLKPIEVYSTSSRNNRSLRRKATNFSVELSKIGTTWNASKHGTDILDGVKSSLTPMEINSLTVTDTLYTIDIKDTTTVKGWFKFHKDTTSYSTLRSYGLVLSPSSSTNKLIAFAGYNQTGIPTLQISYKNKITGKQYTFSSSSVYHISAIKGNMPAVDKDYLLTQGAYTTAARALFDFSKNYQNKPFKGVFKNSIVNKAIMTFEVDTTGKFGQTTKIGDSLYVALFSQTNTDTVNTGYFYLYKTSNGKYSGNVTSLMQYLANGYNNYGIKIMYGRERVSADRVYIKKKSIRINLYYTQLKGLKASK